MKEETHKPYSLEDGEQLVRTARYVVDSFVSSTRFSRWIAEERLEKFTQKHGVFVTIEHYPTRSLRGCIGFPVAQKTIKETLVDAAIAAAAEDPRFVPVSHMEIDHIVIEVNILSTPADITGHAPDTIKRQIKVGRDGLIAKYGYKSGLLLPTVPVENKWSTEKFLEEVCIKAGLPHDKWKSEEISLRRFTSQIFRESSPKGRIEEIILK